MRPIRGRPAASAAVAVRADRRAVVKGGMAAVSLAALGRYGGTDAMAAEALNAWGLGRLDKAMTRHVDDGYIAGAVWAVHRKGETRVGSAGTFETGGGRPMARNTIFRIASLAKPVTAAAAMTLVEGGVLALDEPVDALLPELRERRVLVRVDADLHDTVPAQRAITLRDLLTQRFGLGVIMAFSERQPIQLAMRDAGLAPSAQPPVMSPEAYMERLGGLPLAYQPGEAFLYHTGLDVAGVLIARASGKSLGEVLDERIFTPLGMTDTGFVVPADKLDRLPTAYRSDSQSGALVVFDAAEGGSYSRLPPFESGAGGLVSTIDDYLAFCRMMLNGGALDGTRILQPASVAEMTRDQLTAAQRRAPDALPFMNGHSGWGLGMSVALERAKPSLTPGRFGWDGGTGTSAYTDPEEELIGIFMSQRLLASPDPPKTFADFWNLTYQAIKR